MTDDALESLPFDLHSFLDTQYGADGDTVLEGILKRGADLASVVGATRETPLHVAARRYRTRAVELLVQYGAPVDARTAGGKTAYAHARRRRFSEIADLLASRGASTELTQADRLAVAIVDGKYDEARTILTEHPETARTGNPEEDRLLADVAGRNDPEPVRLLIDANADLEARALDGGTALHQAAWFGQPQNAELLISAGARLEVFDNAHNTSPLGWAVHGSRYSGGADERQAQYTSVVQMLLRAGACLHYPDEPDGDRYFRRLTTDASPAVTKLLQSARAT